MSKVVGVNITVIGIEIGEELQPDEVICDFYNGDTLVSSNFMSDERVRHTFEYSSNFEYVRILIRSVLGHQSIGEAKITFSFLNECKLNSGNEQWLPIINSGDKFFIAKDFNNYKNIFPGIRLRFELIDSLQSSSVIEPESAKIKHFIRSTYSNYQKDSSKPELIVNDNKPSQEPSKLSSGYKTASLRRRYGQDMPVQYDASKNRASNRDIKSAESNIYIHSSNYYIPEDREHLERKLANLVSDVADKHNEILKENDECFRVLDWLNQLNSKPFIAHSSDQEEINYMCRIQDEIGSFYQNINNDDLKDIDELKNDNDKLRRQLDASEQALEKAYKRNEELRVILQQKPGERSDIETLRNENKTLEKQIAKLQDQNKKKVLDYLSSVENPVDLNQLGKSFRGLTEEYKDAIKQFHEEKKNLIHEVNDCNDEYAELVKNNYRQFKKKNEMKNEIEALKNLINNNLVLKEDIIKVNNQFTVNVKNENSSISEEIEQAEDSLSSLNRELSNLKEEFNQNTNIINQLNVDVHNSDISKEYKKLDSVLERLEDSHEKRIDAGIDKENQFTSSEQDTINITKITEKLNSPSPAENELMDLLARLNRVSVEINELTELKSKHVRHKNLLKRKQMLLDSLLLDIEELSKKLKKIQSELNEMKVHMSEMRQEEIEKDHKISIQIETLKTLEIELIELRKRLKDLEGMSIEGFTDQDICDLRELLDRINKEIENLRNKNRKQDEYYAIKKNELLEKEKRIKELRNQLADFEDEEEEVQIPPVQAIEVVDEIDRMMLDYIIEWKCNVPITRMGSGYYLFGTKKIYAKILNGRLVIRVGGGYMIITEFLDQYSQIELNKINRLMEKEGVTRYEDLSIVKSHLQPIWDENEKAKKKRQKSQVR